VIVLVTIDVKERKVKEVHGIHRETALIAIFILLTVRHLVSIYDRYQANNVLNDLDARD
jgi:hypothetical protein